MQNQERIEVRDLNENDNISLFNWCLDNLPENLMFGIIKQDNNLHITEKSVYSIEEIKGFLKHTKDNIELKAAVITELINYLNPDIEEVWKNGM